MIKECAEEASLTSAFVSPRLRNVGVTTYFYVAEGGYLQPEIEYLYDLPVPAVGEDGFVGMKPGDEEVDSFQVSCDLSPFYDIASKYRNIPLGVEIQLR